MNKKSQMEILGLAIVVVLILVATIFVVRFLVINKSHSVRNPFISSELSSNMVNAYIHTSSNDDCHFSTFEELLQDCAVNQGNGIKCDSNINSCDFVKSRAIEIFSKTFDTWKIKYEFQAYVDNSNQPLFKIGNSCKYDKVSKNFPIPTSIGAVYVKLDICTL